MPSFFPWVSAGAALAVAVIAGLVRGRPYVFFVGVLLGVHTLISSAMASAFGPAWPVYAYFQATVYLNFALLARPKLRPTWFRVLISYPASFFSAGTLLAMPWAIVSAFGVTPWGFFVPYLIAAFGFLQSLRARFEEVDVTIDDVGVPSLGRYQRGRPGDARPLRIAQITDPHLGPFMSERRLRAISQRVVDAKPDLVFLTGDFLTMESHRAREVLARALSPLKELEGRVFACHGNHDHEAPKTVRDALEDVGCKLLVDEEAVVETPVGPVQIIGIDFYFRDAAARTRATSERFPRLPGHPRLVLLHNPGAFKYLPDGQADLVFSGHTHGGQLGLLTLGMPHTFVSAFTSVPDHGLWALGRNRMYVHRGTGHYGFPIRIGVPSEESLVRVHRAPSLSAGVPTVTIRTDTAEEATA